MIFFGQLPYDVGYQKKHIRPHGGGYGPLLYPAQILPSWLNFYKSGLKILIWAPEVLIFVVQNQALLPKVPIFETQKMALRVAKSKF